MPSRTFTGTKLPPFVFEVYRAMGASNSPLINQKLLIACSGGLDSVALVDVFLKLRARWNLRLSLAHLHHGEADDEALTLSRDQALRAVESLAKVSGLPFFAARSASSQKLSSEKQMRDFRLATLQAWQHEEGFDRVVMAHHADDLFETRLIRLIRGTGPQGLRAMRSLSPKTARPFLSFSRAQIERYARIQKLSWMDDSSNRDTYFLRNWLRQSWLPALETRQPGARAAFARSLDLLTAAVETSSAAESESGFKLRRAEFHALDPLLQNSKLANLARALNAPDFGSRRLQEVTKRLHHAARSGRKSLVFKVGGLVWTVERDWITVSKQSPEPTLRA